MTEFLCGDFVKHISLFSEGIPEKTDICCWWCCHQFDTRPMLLPLKYNSVKDEFICKGVFCSFSCTKAYISNMNNVNCIVMMQNLKLMSKRMGYSLYDRILSAPPRETLKKFGGYMTIDEFRKKSKDHLKVTIMETKQKIVNFGVMENKRGASDKKNKGLLNQFNDNNNQEVKPQLKLKRDKPLPMKKGTLEHTMGLYIQ